MKTVTQTILYRQALIKYSEKYGVTKAAIRYKTNRQYIYRWKRRYDGTLESLKDRSHRPYHHPNEHTADELKLIADMRKRNANAGLVVFWVKLRQRGYTRSVTGLYRLLRRLGQMAVKPPNPKYIAKPYEQMQYPDKECSSAVFLKHLQKRFPFKIEGVQTDNGQEFTIRTFQRWHGSWTKMVLP